MSEESKKRQQKYYYGCGKRKTSIARVKLFANGSGEVKINNKTLQEFAKEKIIQDIILAPLRLIENEKNFNLEAKVYGGGFRSQSEAIRHGVSRALVNYNELFRGTLKRFKFLTRDSRIKERKKYGLKRARRAPQFAKR